MAKVKPSNLVPGATVRSPGNFLIVNGRFGPYVSKWPRKRGKAKTPADFYKQQEFAIAAAWAADAMPQNVAQAIANAEGVPMVPRDFITMTAYGTAITVLLDDGTTWTKYRDVTVNAQLVLDQVTDTEGALIWRSSIGWIEIPPGNNSELLTNRSGVPQWWPASGGGAGTANVQVFDSSGTWNKPTGCQAVAIAMIGGGGGGGGGARRASGTATSGGSGGGGGAINYMTFHASQLNDTETVTIGAIAAGGAARTGNDLNGNPGGAGNNATMTVGVTTMTAGGGSGGIGGTTATNGGGNGGTIGRQSGANGAAAPSGLAGAAPASVTPPQATGGGSAAGQSVAPGTRNGGAGGSWAAAGGYAANPGNGGIGSTKTAPTTGTPPKLRGVASLGGGGGWANADGTAGAGADGQVGGGGGGGGGSSLNGNNSGKGGDGGKGRVLVIAW